MSELMTVMAIDIRKSTELMQKAKNPEKYAKFIKELINELIKIVEKYHGIFDNFTGDGILAYFLTSDLKKEGILNCCLAAQECHDFFNCIYKEHIDDFDVALDTKLGIGIDYGDVVEINLTEKSSTIIIGNPVVYACRLSNAPAGKTYLNMPAYKEICKDKHKIYLKEIKMHIKNEGTIIVYELERIEFEKRAKIVHDNLWNDTICKIC